MMMIADPAQDDVLLNKRDIARIYGGVSLRGVDVLESKGKIPRRVKLPGANPKHGRALWRRSEVMAHIAGLQHAEKAERAE